MFPFFRLDTVGPSPNGMRSKRLEDDEELYGAFIAAVDRGDLTPRGLAAIIRACVRAWHIHFYQQRKTGEPYIVHPDAVVRMLVLICGVFDPIVIVVAYLHDAAEDQLRRIMPLYHVSRVLAIRLLRREYKSFGKVVVADLQILTKSEDQSKIEYLLDLAVRGSWRALLVKLADRWHNILTLWAREPEDRRREAEMTLEVFPLIVEALLERAPERYHERIQWLWAEIQELCQPYLA